MALADRDYMRPGARRRLPSPAALTVIVLVAAFMVQLGVYGAGGADSLLAWATPSAHSLSRFRLWTFFSYAFLHDGLFHLLFNAVALYSLAGYICEERGVRRYLTLLGWGVFAGAALWSLAWVAPRLIAPGAVHANPAALVGASAAVFALLGYWLADKLRETLRLLLFFVIPASIEGAWILAVLTLVSVVGFVFGELPVATGWWKPFSPDGIAHSAHLAGLLAGFFIRRRELRSGIRAGAVSGLRILRPEFRTRPAHTKGTDAWPKNATPPADLRAEVDRILDKINAGGLGSLTPAERSTLDRAREFMKR